MGGNHENHTQDDCRNKNYLSQSGLFIAQSDEKHNGRNTCNPDTVALLAHGCNVRAARYNARGVHTTLLLTVNRRVNRRTVDQNGFNNENMRIHVRILARQASRRRPHTHVHLCIYTPLYSVQYHSRWQDSLRHLGRGMRMVLSELSAILKPDRGEDRVVAVARNSRRRISIPVINFNSSALAASSKKKGVVSEIFFFPVIFGRSARISGFTFSIGSPALPSYKAPPCIIAV